MNIINILIKLLSAAYTAEAKRADAKAQFNEQLSVKFADARSAPGSTVRGSRRSLQAQQRVGRGVRLSC
ncbi:hypothetical protein [Klebsiella phage vB_KpnP_IME337]|uniref:Uncharacterized protein n=1 Tax=Klebsiella phage vB_KpnP_IME337 TaxID=2601650 RepID=A0A5J6CUC4_9CAUD|nr:hypothetical protein [Klebsiella phage vB_KpnP_IME337]